MKELYEMYASLGVSREVYESQQEGVSIDG